MIKLSIVMPVYNEEGTIHAAVSSVLKQNCVYELIIVDDGSSDGTWSELETLKDTDMRIRIFKQNLNQGKGAALRVGFENAVGDVVGVQDADLEYDSSEYDRFLQLFEQDVADVVYGSRFQGVGAHRVVYFWHSLGNRFLTLLSNMFTNLNLTDMETCYKFFRKDILDRIELKEKRFGVEPEITAKIAKIPNVRIYELPISYYGRTYEEGKKIDWKDGVVAIKCIIKYNLFK